MEGTFTKFIDMCKTSENWELLNYKNRLEAVTHDILAICVFQPSVDKDGNPVPTEFTWPIGDSGAPTKMLYEPVIVEVQFHYSPIMTLKKLSHAAYNVERFASEARGENNLSVHTGEDEEEHNFVLEYLEQIIHIPHTHLKKMTRDNVKHFIYYKKPFTGSKAKTSHGWKGARVSEQKTASDLAQVSRVSRVSRGPRVSKVSGV